MLVTPAVQGHLSRPGVETRHPLVRPLSAAPALHETVSQWLLVAPRACMKRKLPVSVQMHPC